VGDDLGPLIVEVDCLRIELGLAQWSCLCPWCDGGDPRTCDRGALERLLERLCMNWVEASYMTGVERDG